LRKKEKEDDLKAKKAIEAKIEADRKERYSKQAKVEQPVQVPSSKPAEPPKTYDQALIQLRLPDGNSLKATFNPSDPVRAVFNHISLLLGDEKFSLMTTFPRKTFSPRDTLMDTTTLKQAECVPTGTFIVTKL